jgi:hypothetical protein
MFSFVILVKNELNFCFEFWSSRIQISRNRLLRLKRTWVLSFTPGRCRVSISDQVMIHSLNPNKPDAFFFH